MAQGQFLNSKAASKKKDKSAALRTLETLLQQQYKSQCTHFTSGRAHVKIPTSCSLRFAC